jgi:hypothetical protein
VRTLLARIQNEEAQTPAANDKARAVPSEDNTLSDEFQAAARLRGIEKSPIRQLFDRARPNSINLGLGEPDLPTPDVIRRHAARIVAEEQNGYTTRGASRFA